MTDGVLREIHFSFGPVQGFVAQARRTRDLWAGSYLLSYLAGRAMLAVKKAGGRVVFPEVDADPLMKALRDRDDGRVPQLAGNAARVGSLPNRFLAEVPEGVDGGVCERAIRDAWRGIAEAVWGYLGLDRFPEVRERWGRQIGSAWECSWVLAEDGRALDWRKNLRVHLPRPEPGEKCTVCGERQELSGLGMGSPQSREKMRQWWEDLRRRVSRLDLADGERLCAVCATKRFFPHVAEKALGWQVPRSFPSVVYIAAVDWLEKVLIQRPKEAEGYFHAAERLVPRSESETRIRRLYRLLDRAAGEEPERKALAGFLALDGDAFFLEAIEREKREGDWEAGEEELEELSGALRELQKAVGKPSPFYSLLLMDGDHLGRLLGSVNQEGKRRVSEALLQFSQKAAEEVEGEQTGGYLVYAGGDDVLALLPIDTAIACAARCREHYRLAFRRLVEDRIVGEAEATISAAIVFAHIDTPLQVVIQDAHRLLDQVAKKETGRDALACRVWKRGGPVLTWAQPWDSIVVDPQRGRTRVHEVMDRFQGGEDSPQFSSRFFHKLRDLFALSDRCDGDARGEDTLMRMLVAEYLGSRDVTWPRRDDGSPPSAAEKAAEAEKRIRLLLKICCRRQRQIGDDGQVRVEGRGLRADGALLVRFLAQKEV